MKPFGGSDLVRELERDVYREPLDDGPRMVLADHLAQHGDPRGELINLQLARAAGRSDDASRARELALLQPYAWMGPLATAVMPEALVYRRGFLAYARVPRSPAAFVRLAGESAWATIETLDVEWTRLDDRGQDALRSVLDEQCRGITAVIGVPASVVAGCARRTQLERVEHVALATEEDAELLAAWVNDSSRPRRLGVTVGALTARATRHCLGKLLASLEPGRLEVLALHHDDPEAWVGLGRWIELIEQGHLLRAVFEVGDGFKIELTRDATPTFTRMTLYHQVATTTRFPGARALAVLAKFGEISKTFDVSTVFVPGATVQRSSPNIPVPTVGGVVDDLHEVGRLPRP